MPGTYDILDAYAGDTYAAQFDFFDSANAPLDLRKYPTILMQIKPKLVSTASPVFSFGLTNNPLTPFNTLTSDGMTIGGVSFNSLFLEKQLTLIGGKNYFYDIELTDADGIVTTWLAGAFNLIQDVTNSQIEK